ncbi:MAG: SPOR domain-containing protein [Fluviicola sp.]
MLTVEQLIADLLLQHNCVIVPGFGGFVAQRIPAQIDTEKGQVHPPKKSILFNRQLIANDGLLIATYAQRLGVSFEHAQSTVNALIRSWDEQLRSEVRISIDRVGILYLDAERNICFEQDRFSNLLLQSFGLTSVRFVSSEDALARESKNTVEHVLKTVEQQQEKKVEQVRDSKLESLEKTILSEEPKVVHFDFTAGEIKSIPIVSTDNSEGIIELPAKKSRLVRYAAAAILLPIAFYSFWIPLRTDVLDSGVISLSDFNPLKTYKKGTYIEPTKTYKPKFTGVNEQVLKLSENVETYSLKISDDDYLEVKVKGAIADETQVSEVEPVVETIPEVKETPKKVTPNSSGKIIVGSYTSLATAQDLIQQLKANGFTPEVIEKDGKVRVSAGDASSSSVLVPKLKALGIDSWILK